MAPFLVGESVASQALSEAKPGLAGFPYLRILALVWTIE